MFRDILKLPVETPKNPFVKPTNIQTIEAFMNRVGYQGVVDKVSAFNTKNLAQPWHTMFKVFHRCLTTRTSGHDQTKINILQLFHVVINCTDVDYAALLWWDFMNSMFWKKEVIQYPRFIKLIIADLMKKFPNIPKRVDVPMNQPQPVVSIQETHRTLPRAIRSPTVSVASPQRKKTKQSVEEYNSPRKSLKVIIKLKKNVEKEKDDDNSEDRIEHGSHKTEETQITIPTLPSTPRKILSSDNKIDQELMDDVSNPTTTTSKHSHFKIHISGRYSHLPGALRRMCRRQGYMIQDVERKFVATDDLIEYNLKPCIAKTIIEDRDVFQSEVPALISQEFKTHAPRIIEDLFKEYVQSNVIHVHLPTTTSIEPNSSVDLQHQMHLKMKSSLQDRADDIVLYEVIPEDKTRELIAEFQNIDKHVPTIFDRPRMETALKDLLSNQFRNAEEYA
ncbi:hypothetical protein Tco_0394185 [Tanacetum coccineum]